LLRGAKASTWPCFIDDGTTEILERAPAGCGLVGSKDGGEVLSIASEDSEVGGAAAHACKEGHLPAFVNDWFSQQREGSADGWDGGIEDDRDRAGTVISEDALGTNATCYECVIGDHSLGIGRIASAQILAAAAGRGVSALHQRNSAPTIAAEEASIGNKDDVTTGGERRGEGKAEIPRGRVGVAPERNSRRRRAVADKHARMAGSAKERIKGDLHQDWS